MAENINIAGRLHSTATGNVVAGADEVLYEPEAGSPKKQSKVNEETYEHVRSIDNAISELSPDQQEALALAQHVAYIGEDDGQGSIPEFDPASQSLHIIPQVLSESQKKQTRENLGLGDGDIDTVPTKDSANLITSGGVSTHGSAYDISDINKVSRSPATYASLSAAIAAIPDNIKRGGMSIKYIQSSDNKYVQARCMAQSFTTDVTQWQGIDDEPTAESNNMVKSGGVALSIGKFDLNFETYYRSKTDANKIPLSHPFSAYTPLLATVIVNEAGSKITVRYYDEDGNLIGTEQTFSNVTSGTNVFTPSKDVYYIGMWNQTVEGLDGNTDYHKIINVKGFYKEGIAKDVEISKQKIDELSEVFQIVDSPEFSEMTLDAEGYLVSSVEVDGTKNDYFLVNDDSHINSVEQYPLLQRKDIITNKSFGVNVQNTGCDWEVMSEVIERHGFGSVRVTVPITGVDYGIAEFINKGFDVIGNILKLSTTDIQNVLTEVLNTYDKIVYWEFFNELNSNSLISEIQGSNAAESLGVDAEYLGTIFGNITFTSVHYLYGVIRRVYEVAKAIRTDIKILNGGFATNEGVIPSLFNLTDEKGQHIWDYFDIYNFHCYSYNNFNRYPEYSREQVKKVLAFQNDTYDANNVQNFVDKPVWVTEFGANREMSDDGECAKIIAAEAMVLLSAGVERVFIYTSISRENEISNAQTENFYGIFENLLSNSYISFFKNDGSLNPISIGNALEKVYVNNSADYQILSTSRKTFSEQYIYDNIMDSGLSVGGDGLTLVSIDNQTTNENIWTGSKVLSYGGSTLDIPASSFTNKFNFGDILKFTFSSIANQSDTWLGYKQTSSSKAIKNIITLLNGASNIRLDRIGDAVYLARWTNMSGINFVAIWTLYGEASQSLFQVIASYFVRYYNNIGEAQPNLFVLNEDIQYAKNANIVLL